MLRILLLGGLLFSFNAFAAEDEKTFDYVMHQHYISVRALGSGNSFTVIDDYNTLFYNPAGLARLEAGEINAGFMAAITPSAMTFVKDIESASGAAESEKTAKVQEVLEKNYGKNYATRLPAPNFIWTRPKWGLGIIIADSTINMAIHKTGGPQVYTSAYVDNTLAFGYAKGFLENNALTAGATIKAIYRGYVGTTFNAFDLATDPSFFKPKDAKEGMTIDVDLGTQYVMPVPESGALSFLKYAKPTFGFVIRNALDYGFKQNLKLISKDSGNEPPKMQRRFDIGSKWELPSFWVFHPKFMFDVRDMGHRYWTFLKGLHTGVELQWKAMNWLQGHYSMGLSQGYFTAGIGAQLAWFRLDAATYGEEIGTSKQKLENRFYIAKMSLDF